MSALHPENRGFTWAPRRGPYRRITGEQAAQYDADGYFLLVGAFDAGTVAGVIAAIDPIEARVEAMLRKQPDETMFIATADAITFCPHLVTRSRVLRDFCRHPVFADLAHDLLGPDVRLYWEQAVYKKPERPREFPWHQDNGYTYVEPQQYLTCWVALTDATLENGCPWVAPGRHREGTLRHELTPIGWRCFDDVPDAVPVVARAGSIVVFSSLTPHRTGANVTGAVRKAYIVQFAPDGAAALRDGERVAQDDPERQFPVLVGGMPARTETGGSVTRD